MADRRVLRSSLLAITQLCSGLHQTAPASKQIISEIRRIVANMSVETLEISLPDVVPARAGFYGNIYTADIHENRVMSCVVFGMKNAGDQIPLHDHRHNFGFIRVLRGSLRVRSFTFLNDPTRVSASEPLLVRYEGTRDFSPPAKDDSQGVAFLDPAWGNVHEVTALEDGTAFFDVLTPGYASPTACVYYEEMTQSAEPGQTVQLKSIPPPRTYYTEPLWYTPIVQL